MTIGKKLGLLVACVAAAVALAVPATAAAAIEITSFGGEVVDNAGNPVTQAGAHPDMTTKFELAADASGLVTESLKDIRVDLPAGTIFNPTAVSSCTQPDIAGATTEGYIATCAGTAQVGVMELQINFGSGPGATFWASTPIYNAEVGDDVPARFSANLSGVIVSITGAVRSGGDYGISADIVRNSQTLPVRGAKVTLWGVPADPIHDPARVCGGKVYGCSSGSSRKALISAPAACTGDLLETDFSINSWENPNDYARASIDHDFNGNPFEVTGCDSVNFEPTLKLQPESRATSTPSAVDVSLRIPQSEDPDGLATAMLDRAVVTLPEGMTVNPSSAVGAVGCSPAQIGLDNDADPTCPDGSKIGSVRIDTPLLTDPLDGSVYLAQQGSNPFGSLLALYLVAEGPGVIIKLPGKVTPDPQTGRLTTTFNDNPQLPFEEMTLHFNGGSRAPLVTPAACGSYTTEAEFRSWSQPNAPIVSTDTFVIDQGCAKSTEFTPGFEAGSSSPIGGDHSPFTLRVSRDEGEQNVSRIAATLPEGLLAKLAGLALCGDAAATTGDCPASSQVGTTTVGAGSGANPLYVPEPGKAPTAVYLGGPYKGAPLSLIVKIPAQAGPFDLGVVTVRNALNVDPVTTQVSVASDPLPQILQGIPVTYRDIRVDVNRPEFTINPTNCGRQEVNGTITSSSGLTAPVSDRFQVVDCERLAFKPKLAMRLYGAPPRRGGFPALKAVLTAPEGQANIGKATVLMPKTELLEQGHIRTLCTRDQWASDSCPAGSIYGKAKAFTPLLDKPLEGNVYLRSNGGARELPDLVADLRGQIDIELVGYIDAVNARLRARFLNVPDARVSKFVLQMQGGRKGLLAHNTNVCKTTPRASVKFDGQNGKVHDFNPKVAVGGCGKKGK